MPGPGYYGNTNDLTGANHSNSIMTNSTRNIFPKANDRFKQYDFGFGPPCSKYNVDNGYEQNVSSKHKKPLKATIGLN